ncbi:FlaD/FlaE family flagellar protein [Natronomonas sp. LN261]|uniref:FlaD/FlaE family flagellar protein n=1 Tax=Natronomonas sp. LN261 TaxID=2750669 RepID=UPI0015EFD9FC|nr:FlaD/FlaE family flagellar protein [Natronomonas sp. LN261]
MTGRLNPRGDDPGESHGTVREPPHRPGSGEATSERRDGANPPDGNRSVPVEATSDTSAPGRGAGVDPDPADTLAGTAESTEPPADDVESYLQSRHRRRDHGGERPTHRWEHSGERERAGQRPSPPHDEPAPPQATGSAPTPAAFLAELSGPEVSRPYLDRLPDAYTAQLEVFEWLEGLLTAGGPDATTSALAYYESIGWLSERSREELEDVVSGLSAPGPGAAAPSLGIDDHRESLRYIARLAHRRNR